MSNSRLTFNVTGRYMDGPQVVGYQLVGTDGSQLQVNNDRVIYMIGRGEIENMRIQYSNGDVVPRGKGINLQKLPIFDVNKNSFRGNEAQQKAASMTNKSNFNTMGQQTITKRIMRGRRVEGYVLTDFQGKEKKLPRSKVIELAQKRVISNATVSKYNPYKGCTLEEAKRLPRFKQEEWDYVQKYGYITRLNGQGVQLDTLPVLVILQDGQIVDPKDITKYDKMTMRAFHTSRGGVIYGGAEHTNFQVGDWIVVKPDGQVQAMSQQEFNRRAEICSSQSQATCDGFLDNLENFDIELFGAKRNKLQVDAVKSWKIVKIQDETPTEQ